MSARSVGWFYPAVLFGAILAWVVFLIPAEPTTKTTVAPTTAQMEAYRAERGAATKAAEEELAAIMDYLEESR